MPIGKKLKGAKNRIIRRIAKDITLSWYFPYAYRRAAKQPVDPGKVIFLEGQSLTLSDNFKALWNYLDEGFLFNLEFVSLGKNKVRLRRYYKNCLSFIREMATASYVFLNDANDVVSCLPVRKETRVIQLWHACGAFKKWGMSTADLIFGGTKKQILRHPFYENLSLVTVSSPEVIWAYAEAMILEDKKEIIKPLGVSRTDVFFDEGYIKEARAHVEQFIPVAKGKKVILYAPTFRGRVAAAKAPDKLDINAFCEVLSDEYVLLIKHHPFVKDLPPIPRECSHFAFHVSGDIPIAELLCVADICISDYSSLVFEYSLFERPMLFFAYDIDEYNDWRGFYYDYDELTPGPVFSDNESMLNYVKNVGELFDINQVRGFKNKFMSGCDGKSTQRICQEVFGGSLDMYRKPTAHDVLSSDDPEGVDVSIVIPASNAMPELTRALYSIEKQTYDLSRIEVIVTDDCSSDGTWDEIQRFVAKSPNLFVAERLSVPSGSPAKPRNVGLGKARGRYVFFMDADDWLGEEAVERMLNHAVDWDSDVLLVRMKGENGREVPKSMFGKNQSQVDICKSKVMWSLGPLKLFKRDLLLDNGLCFFEGGMPEDLHVVVPAMRLASTVSVASDYEYYHVSWRNDSSQNASNHIWTDFDSNMRSYTQLMDFIRENFVEDERCILMRRLFRRDVLMMIEDVKGRSEEEIGSRCAVLKRVFGSFYSRDVYKTCPDLLRLKLDGLFFGNEAILSEIVECGNDLVSKCSYEVRDGRLFCTFYGKKGNVTSDVTDAVSLSVRLSRVDRENGLIHVVGSVVMPISLKGSRCSLALVNPAAQSGCCILCDLVLSGYSEEESGNGAFSLWARWEGSLDIRSIAEKNGEGKYKLFWRIENGTWEKAVRIGSDRAASVRQSFEKTDNLGRLGKVSGKVGSDGAFTLVVSK